MLELGVVVLNQLIFTVSTLGGCGSLERTDFEQLILWEGVVVLKELIFTLGHFEQVLHWDSVEVSILG